MFEQEHLRFINMYMAAKVSGGSGSGGAQMRCVKGIMEHEVVQSVREANGDKSCFRQ